MKSPRCPDCSSRRARPIVYGEPGADLVKQADTGAVVLGGCLISNESPSWDCPDCGRSFGSLAKPRALPVRSLAEWAELIETMVPAPHRREADGVIAGGDPVTVLVRLDDAIHILEPELVWDGPSVPRLKATPFAKVPWHAAASRVAELITLAQQQAAVTVPLVPPVPRASRTRTDAGLGLPRLRREGAQGRLLMVTHHIADLQDTRLTALLRVGGGEGFGLYTALFEGQLAMVADCSTFNEFLDEHDLNALPVQIMVFESEGARDSYVASLLRR